jgi:Tol biopolymer transport system component
VLGPAAAGTPEGTTSGSAVVRFRQGTNLAAAVSPAGDRLIVEIQGILWALDRQGGRAAQLTSWELEPARPDWSPTGEAVTFEAYRGGNFHIWTMAPDGSRLRQWTDGPWDDREPAWSPDGTRIAFCSDRAVGDSLQRGSYDIWVLDVGTGGLTRLTSDAGEDYEPTWSPDGRRVYLNEVHRLRPLDDPRGVFPPPDRAWLTANRTASEQFPNGPARCWRRFSSLSPTPRRWTSR